MVGQRIPPYFEDDKNEFRTQERALRTEDHTTEPHRLSRETHRLLIIPERKLVTTMEDMKSMKIQKKSYSAFSPLHVLHALHGRKTKRSPRRKSTRRQTAQNPAHTRRARCPPHKRVGQRVLKPPYCFPLSLRQSSFTTIPKKLGRKLRLLTTG